MPVGDVIVLFLVALSVGWVAVAAIRSRRQPWGVRAPRRHGRGWL